MDGDEVEDLESFRQRARAFDPRQPATGRDPTDTACCGTTATDEEELAAVAREREIQRMLFDAGLAGICFPAPTAARA